MNSIVDLMGLKLDIPDHTTLSRRSKTIQISKIHPASKNSVVIIDSTGLKVLGETEWMNYKHGTRQRKIWRKLHIAVNGNGNILSSRLTTHRASDSSAVNQILQPIQSPIFEVIADGGYDAKATYTALNSHQDLPIRAIIPPNTGFKAPSENDDEQRLYNIGVIADKGKYHWQNDTNYGRRSIVENTFHRYKSTFGNKLKSRNIQSQKTETQLAINILNKMVELSVSNAKISK